MRPLTLRDFYDAEGSTLTLSDPDPDDEPLPLDAASNASTKDKRHAEPTEDAADSIDDGAMPDSSNDEIVELDSR